MKSQDGFRSRLWVVALILLPIYLRGLLWIEKGLSFGFGDWVGLAWDLHGAWLVMVVAVASLRVWRWGALAWTLFWGLVCFANYEFVAALDLPLDPGQSTFLLDPLFLRGSVLAPSHPLLILVAFGGLVLLVPKRSPERPSWRPWLLLAFGGLLVGVGLARVEPSQQISQWRQQGPSFELFRWAASGGGMNTSSFVVGQGEVAESLQMDLGGVPRAGLDSGQRATNVLIVLLEGASGVHLPSIAEHHGIEGDHPLVETDRILQEGLVLPHFMTQQRQTHRGEYAVLCGDYPRLARGAAWFTITDRPWPHSCLPERLVQAGYETVYLQAAPLPFMMKDQALQRTGFSRVQGLETFDSGGFRTQWGVDDRTFFDGAIRLLEELQVSDSPWMVTLLTVGTHHPYTLPPGSSTDDSGGEIMNPRDLAFRYLDRSFAEFWGEASARGLLEDTLVVITSDESVGVTEGSDAMRDLSQNVGFAGLLGPGLRPGATLDPYQQSDLAATILDYLGLATQDQDFTGRSPLRTYQNPRAVYFANFYLRRTFGLFPGNRLITCTEGGGCTGRQLAGRSLLSRGEPIPEAGVESRWVEAVREYSFRERPAGSAREAQLEERTVELVSNVQMHLRSPYQHLLGGQDLEIAEGAEFSVRLELLNEGGGWVHLRHDLRADGRVLLATDLGVLGPGDRVRFGYRTLSSGWRSTNIAVTANLLAGDEVALRVESARAVIRPNESGGTPRVPDEVIVQEESLSRHSAPPPRSLGLAAIHAEEVASCLGRESSWGPWRGACESGLVVAGPRFYAPMGSQLQLRWTVAGSGGTLSTLIGSQEEQVGIGSSDPIVLQSDESQVVALEVPVPVRLNELQVGLIWKAQESDAWLEVQDLELEIVDP